MHKGRFGLSKKTIFCVMMLLLCGVFMMGLSGASAQENDGEIWARFGFDYNGMQRTFSLYVPASYDPDGDPVTLVMAFHPSGSNALGMAGITGFNALAAQSNVIMAYPEGPLGYWDYGYGTPGWAQVGDAIDDPGYLTALYDYLLREFTIDEARTYAVGYSNGARMAFRLGCYLGDRLAAIGAVSATISDEVTTTCPEDSRVSVVYMHGMNDTITPFEGKPLFIGTTFISNALSAPDTVAFWANQNGCDIDDATVTQDPFDDTGDVTLTQYTNCELDTVVAFYVVGTGRHAWFDRPDIRASTIIWDFFMTHPRGEDHSGAED